MELESLEPVPVKSHTIIQGMGDQEKGLIRDVIVYPLRVFPDDRGHFAEVFRAYDPDLDREVALKLLWPGSLWGENGREFINEARRHAKVRHANVVTIRSADRFEGRVGLWTDLVDGETLEDCLKRQGPFGEQEATEIAGRWLAAYRPGVTVEEHADPFYGYYTIHTQKDGEIEGMLSVHGTTGQVWYHTWHGAFFSLIAHRHRLGATHSAMREQKHRHENKPAAQ